MTTQTKHTQGPWKISEYNHLEIIGGNTRFKPDMKHLACLCTIDETYCSEEDGANARLIAAAPELLEALKSLMTQAAKDAQSYAPDGNEPIWAFIADSTEAILKAEGK